MLCNHTDSIVPYCPGCRAWLRELEKDLEELEREDAAMAKEPQVCTDPDCVHVACRACMQAPF